MATSSAAAPPAPAVLQELAPTGKLRVGINYGNPVLAAEAFASSKNRLAAVADNDSNFRVLEGRFAAIPHAVAVPAERKAALAYVTALMEQLKASGFVQRAVDESRVRGVVVLPAQATK